MRENRTHGSEGGEANSLPYPYRLDATAMSVKKTWVPTDQSPWAEGPRAKLGHGDTLRLHRIVAAQPISIPRTALPRAGRGRDPRSGRVRGGPATGLGFVLLAGFGYGRRDECPR